VFGPDEALDLHDAKPMRRQIHWALVPKGPKVSRKLRLFCGWG
jgi:hypothetical protein